MANAVTVYRDMSLSDRTAEPSIAAMLAYLEESAQPQPPPPPLPPLPPLAPARRVGTQNLPPVRNLLTQPEDWTQPKQDQPNKSKQNNVVQRKVRYPAQFRLTLRFHLLERLLNPLEMM